MDQEASVGVHPARHPAGYDNLRSRHDRDGQGLCPHGLQYPKNKRELAELLPGTQRVSPPDHTAWPAGIRSQKRLGERDGIQRGR